MKFNELELSKKANKKRVGRGISAGQGKTAGRGTKGQKSRTGKKLRAGFEGGQNPLMQRIPKLKGFKSLSAPAQVIYTTNLEMLKGKTADNFSLFEAGLIADPYHAVKVIVQGELKKAYSVSVQGASKGAQDAIKKAGGSFTKVDVPQRQAKTEKK